MDCKVVGSSAFARLTTTPSPIEALCRSPIQVSELGLPVLSTHMNVRNQMSSRSRFTARIHSQDVQSSHYSHKHLWVSPNVDYMHHSLQSSPLLPWFFLITFVPLQTQATFKLPTVHFILFSLLRLVSASIFIDLLSPLNFQFMWLKIRFPSLNHHFCIAYRSSNSNDPIIFDLLSSNMEALTSADLSFKITVRDDFSIHNKDWLLYSSGTSTIDVKPRLFL